MARVALEAKAEDVVILDLRKLSYSFDFFVLCSASSDRRILTIAEGIEEKLAPHPVDLRHREGHEQGGWILLDYGPVVTHIFSPEVRQFYGLERLWADAPTVPVGS